MKLVDTHCHLHDSEFYPENREEVYAQSIAAGVTMLCVGTSEKSSQEAIDFARTHDNVHAIIGVHPHDTKHGWGHIREMLEKNRENIIGIGEIGLDYFYTNSPKETQKQALREQLTLARKHDLPVSFHVRDAFDDFWPIFDEYKGVRGVLHSFTDTKENLDKALARGLYIGLNGISTFTKDDLQRKLYQILPLKHILLETDAPFLTPKPIRGKMNIPAYVELVARFHAEARGVSVEEIARVTTANAYKLFEL